MFHSIAAYSDDKSYVVTIKNDTIYGKINKISDDKVYFLKDTIEVIYTTSDLKYVYFNEEESFFPIKIDKKGNTSFARLAVKGAMSMYFVMGKYFIGRDSDSCYFSPNSYNSIGYAKYYLKDCEKYNSFNDREYYNRYDNSFKGMQRLVTNYNECVGSEQKVIVKSESMIGFGGNVGINYIGFNGNYPSIGAHVDVLYRKFRFQTGISTLIFPRYLLNEFPFLLKYSPINKKINPILFGGPGFIYLLNSMNMSFSGINSVLYLGGGVKYRYSKDLYINFEMRYVNNLPSHASLGSYQNINFSIGFSFR